MTITECNLALAKLNPYLDKPKIRELLKIRRGLIKQQDKNVQDALNDINIPESLREQN